MKKSLIALAVAGALTAPMVAQADATLYGSFRIGLQGVDDADMDLVDESSRIGIKGDVDLGLDGTKGLFHWEANINTTDSSTDILKERLSYIGMTGDWGTALVGRQYHPHYLWVNIPTDIFNTATSKTGEWAQLGNDFHKRVDNTLAYASPNMNGFQAIVGLVIASDGDDSTQSATDLNDEVDGYNAAVRYSANNLTLAASIGEVSPGETVEDNETWGLAATYKMDALTVVARYEDKENFAWDVDADGNGTIDADTAIEDANAWELGAIYDLGNGLSVKGRYSKLEVETATAEFDGDQWGAEVEQKLGKGRVYANYMAFDSEAEDNFGMADVWTLGYRVDF